MKPVLGAAEEFRLLAYQCKNWKRAVIRGVC